MVVIAAERFISNGLFIVGRPQNYGGLLIDGKLMDMILGNFIKKLSVEKKEVGAGSEMSSKLVAFGTVR